MRSAKSFFNGAIARSDLRRYWPVLFLYVGLWLLFLPIPVWNRAAERNPALVNLTELCADTYATAVVLALIFGGIMATAVFSYLMQTRSVGAMHALPQRRGTLFWTHFLTGWAMLAAGNLLVLAVTALTALLGGLALTPTLLTWFVVATLLDLIFLALGTLCAMVTGWLLAVPVLYAAVNCLAVALTWLGQQLAELLLDGFTMPDVQPVITRWLTPVYQLICDLGQSGPSYSPFFTGVLPENYIQNADCVSGLTPQGWRTLLIFTAVALVLTVLSRLLYGQRKSELSGDAAAFSWMRPVFRLGVGLVGGLPLGMLLYILVSVGRSGDFSPARLCVCMAVMGIVCYLAAAMLVGKTLRVLPKRLPGAAVTALVGAVLAYVMFNGNVPPSGWQPTGGGLWLNTTIETRELTAEEAQALYDAAWRDIRAENVLPVDGDYAWLGVEITLFRDGDSRTISSTKSSYKELTQALLDLGVPESDLGEILID